jgi:15-cis-phytoene synthase
LPRDRELARARRTTRRVARTFGLACRLLPRAVRDDVYRLYLVFRSLDDLVDEHAPEASERVSALADWAAGRPAASPETHILDGVDARRPLPREALQDFAAGMRFDLDGRSITSQEALDTYCYRVAGTVGLVMNAVLGGGPEAAGAAVALGSAMQLTNILRDIDEDLGAGRRYLPAAAGELAPGRRGELLRRHIARADAGYDAALEGVAQLPQGRAAIRAAGAMYREILRQLERDGRASRAGRSHVALGRKLWVATRAQVGGPRISQGSAAARFATSAPR